MPLKYTEDNEVKIVVDENRTLIGGDGISSTGLGDLSNDRTINVDNSVTRTSNQAVSFPSNPLISQEVYRADLSAFFKWTGSEWVEI